MNEKRIEAEFEKIKDEFDLQKYIEVENNPTKLNKIKEQTENKTF